MSALGSLVVKLGLEYAQFTQGLDKNEQAVLASAKKVQDAYDKLGRAVESRMDSVKESVVRAVAGAASIAGLMSVFGRIRAETINSEKEQAQLAAALRSTGEAAGYSQERLNDMAAALSKATNYSAGEISQAQARLLSYTNIVGEQFPRALRAAMDMGTRLGMDLNASMETVAKAIDKPSAGMQALQRQGFKFTESQVEMAKALENSGRLADAQAIVFKELETSYGGAAEAARDTLGGALQAVGNTINDLLTADSASIPELRQSVEDFNTLLQSDSSRNAFAFYVSLMVDTANAAAQLGVALAELRNGGLGGLLGAATSGNAGSELVAVEGKLAKLRADAMVVDPSAGLRNKINDVLFGDFGDLQRQIGLLEDQREVLLRNATAAGGFADSYESLTEGNEALLAALSGTTQAVQAQGAAVGLTDSFLKKYGTTAQKAALEIAEWKAKLGDAFTPEMEAQIRAVYAKMGKSAAEARGPVLALIDSIEKRAALLSLEREGEEKLTEGQKLAVDVLEQLRTGKVKVTEAESALIGKRLESLLVQEKQVALDAEERKARDAWRADRIKQAEAVEQSAGALLQSNDELAREIELIGLTQRQQVNVLRLRSEALILTKQATVAELERRDALSAADTVMLASLKSEIEQLKRRNDLLGAKFQRETWADEGKRQIEELNRSAEKLGDIFRTGFADMLNNGREGLKAFGKSLKTTATTALADGIYQALAQPYVVQIVAHLAGLTGGGGLGAAGGLANMASGAMNLISSGLNIAGMGGEGMMRLADMAYQWGMGSVGELVDSFRYGMMDAGSWAGFQGAFEAGGAQLAGAVAGSLLNGFAGYGISRLISGGYQVNKWVDRIGGIASAIPGIGPIAGVVSGVVNRLFGRKLKDQGIEGDFGGETGFEGNTYQYFKGGLFRSNKTVRGELDEDVRKGLADQFNAMRLGTAAMAGVLGLGTAAIQDFTASIKVSFNGLTESEIQKRLQEEFDKIAEVLAGNVLGTQDYTRAGETAVETLTRLSGSLTTANAVLENLNGTLFASSLAGADMASQLLDLFGGASGFNQATGAFFQNFYSPEEQREALRRSLQAQMDQVGLQLPDINADDARAQFAALAHAQDLTTEEGRRTWAALMQLSGAFASITRSAEDAATAAQQLAEEQAKAAKDALWDAMRGSIEASRAAAQAEVELRESRIAAARTIVDLTREQVRELRALVAGTSAASAAKATAWIDQATAAARSGELPDADKLRQAIADARAGMGTGAYGSRQDYEAAQLILANKLEAIGVTGAAEVDLNELLLEQARASVDRFDLMLKAGRDALDEARANTLAVTGVEGAVRELYARMFEEEDAAKAAASGAITFSGIGGGGGSSSGAGGYASKSDRIRETFKDADLGNLRDVAQTAWLLGYSQSDIAAAYGVSQSDLERMFEAQGVPAFARGGMFGGGLRLVGEEGPELEVTGAARLYSARQTQQMLAGALNGGGGGGDGAMVGMWRDFMRQQYDLQRAMLLRLDSLETLARKSDAIGVKQRKVSA